MLWPLFVLCLLRSLLRSLRTQPSCHCLCVTMDSCGASDEGEKARNASYWTLHRAGGSCVDANQPTPSGRQGASLSLCLSDRVIPFYPSRRTDEGGFGFGCSVPHTEFTLTRQSAAQTT